MAEDEEIDVPAIAARFLAQAPPLQFPPVLDDVKVVIDNAAVTDAVAPIARKAYNLSQMTAIDGPEIERFLVTEHGETGQNEYLDPHTEKVHTVDHMAKSVTATRDATPEEMGGDAAGLRKEVQAKVKAYASENFSDSVGTATYAKGGKLLICISAAEFDARNMWSGRWRSSWTCTVEADNIAIEGEFHVDTHFYEDGNVQSHSTHKVTDSACPGEDHPSTAEAIVDIIKSAETKYQSMLDGAYVNLLQDHSIMNGLRRPLPIDKQKINFKTLVSQGRLAGSLK